METVKRMLLRAGEAAEMLGIGRSTLYELAAKKVIPTIRVGQALRFPREHLIQWIEQQLDGVTPRKADRRHNRSSSA